MKRLTIKSLRNITTTPSCSCWKQWHVKGMLNKIENWIETLGDWYGAIFPQEHPGPEMALTPGLTRNSPLHRYHHRPDKYDALLHKQSQKLPPPQ